MGSELTAELDVALGLPEGVLGHALEGPSVVRSEVVDGEFHVYFVEAVEVLYLVLRVIHHHHLVTNPVANGLCHQYF